MSNPNREHGEGEGGRTGWLRGSLRWMNRVYDSYVARTEPPTRWAVAGALLGGSAGALTGDIRLAVMGAGVGAVTSILTGAYHRWSSESWASVTSRKSSGTQE